MAGDVNATPDTKLTYRTAKYKKMPLADRDFIHKLMAVKNETRAVAMLKAHGPLTDQQLLRLVDRAGNKPTLMSLAVNGMRAKDYLPKLDFKLRNWMKWHLCVCGFEKADGMGNLEKRQPLGYFYILGGKPKRVEMILTFIGEDPSPLMKAALRKLVDPELHKYDTSVVSVELKVGRRLAELGLWR